MSRSHRRRRVVRPSVDLLESRVAPAIDFIAATGLHVVGSPSDLDVNALALGPGGEIYLTGSFQGTASFDPANSANTRVSKGSRDSFIASYTANHQLRWVVTFEGSSSTSSGQGSSIGVDPLGAVYVAGGFVGTVDFDPSASRFDLLSPARTDIFVAKLSSAGTLLWARSVPGSLETTHHAHGLAVDSDQGVIISGSYAGSATFGAQTLVATGPTEAYAAKLSAAGDFLWAVGTRGGAGTVAEMRGVAVDSSGNITAAGFSTGTVDFDPSSGTRSLVSQGIRDVAVWSLTPTGSLRWAVGFGGSDVDWANEVAIDPTGGVFVAGSYTGTVDFDPGPGTTQLTATGSYDPFLIKLNDAGSFSSARGFALSPSAAGEATGLAIDSSGRPVVAGWFSGTIDANPGTGVSTLVSAGGTDHFLVALDSQGGLVDAERAGGAGGDLAFALGRTAAGRHVVAGSTKGPSQFGGTSIPLVGTNQVVFAGFDVTHPIAAPAAPVLAPSSDTGSSSSDGITSLDSLEFTVGSAAVDHTIRLMRDGVLVATRLGTGSIVDPGPIPAGVRAYTAIQVSPSGASSPSSATTTVTVDKTPPSAPTALALLASDDTGAKGDGITAVSRPSLQAVAEIGTIVELIDAQGIVLASATTALDGRVTLRPANSLPEGLHLVAASARDIAGNRGGPGATFALRIDTTPPAPPLAPTLFAGDDSGTAGDRLTAIATPRLHGTTEPGASVRILQAQGIALASGLANSTGEYTIMLSVPLLDGTHSLRVDASDVAGNLGAAGPVLSLTIDTSAPAAPSAPSLDPVDDSGVVGDGVTSRKRPNLTGSAESDSTLELLDALSNVVASTVVGGDGRYSVRPAGDLSDATHTFRTRATDRAGNRGTVSSPLVIRVDSIAPAAPSAPTLTPADDSGAPGDSVTSNDQPEFTGSAEPGATVLLLDASGTTLAQASAGVDGSYRITPASAFLDGIHGIRVMLVDAAGNASALSPILTISIDTTAPTKPSSPTLAPADDSGTLGDSLTNRRRPTLNGTAEPLATIRLRRSNGSILSQISADASGIYAIRPDIDLFDGEHLVDVVAVDAAGNSSLSSALVALRIDATSPATPAAPLLAVGDDTGVLGDRITRIRRPRMTASVEPSAEVRLVDGAGLVRGSGTSGSTGTIELAPAEDLADGVVSLRFVVIDAAGNVGAAGAATSITIDATPPSAVSSLGWVAADDSGVAGDRITNHRRPRITGTADPNVEIILDIAGARTSLRADSEGRFTIGPASDLVEGEHVFTLLPRDDAGNEGPTGASSVRISLTPPAGPTILLDPLDDSGVAGDATTVRKRPALVGTTSPGSFVELLDGSGAVLGSSQAASNGSFRVVPVLDLKPGAPRFTARVRDVAGNQGSPGPSLTLKIIAPFGDFFGEGLGTKATYRGTDALWSIVGPTGAITSRQYGWAGVDIPLVADFDGDGRSDHAVFRPPSAEWFILNSGSNTLTVRSYGWAGVDLPVPADYDGDGRADLAVYRPVDAKWYIFESSTQTLRIVEFGWPGVDLPVPADHDGDGKADISVYRPIDGNWFVRRSTDAQTTVRSFGWAGVDVPIPMDFDGDGKADLAVFRPPTYDWFILESSTGVTRNRQYGWVGVDQPVPADYDGDGRVDFAVFRPPTAELFVLPSSVGQVQVSSLGPAGSKTGLLRPQATRLSGLRPILAAAPAGQRVPVPSSVRAADARVALSDRPRSEIPAPRASARREVAKWSRIPARYTRILDRRPSPVPTSIPKPVQTPSARRPRR
ncbi:MAG: Ig-like domain-containing protein [Isosphaeraceae bacterium]|nr:Ig-like domain-containing protein [Isosphaeraceae bacterium]